MEDNVIDYLWGHMSDQERILITVNKKIIKLT